MMRGLLVMNPKATTTSRRVRDVLVRALGSQVKVDVAETERPGHGRELAVLAGTESYDVLLALGGDGTLNEIVNGMMTVERSARPALAVVPGGNANVFSRSLGQPRDPVETTSLVLEALREGRQRPVGLGRIDDRYFTFCAGVGLDAEVIRQVEADRRNGRAATPHLFLRDAVRRYVTVAHPRRLRIVVDGVHEPGKLAQVVVCNTRPWTYLGPWAVHACPRASLETSLDVFAMRGLGPFTLGRALGQMMLTPTTGPTGRQVLSVHDATEVTITASVPTAVQVDGEYVGDRRSITFTHVPDAITLVG